MTKEEALSDLGCIAEAWLRPKLDAFELAIRQHQHHCIQTGNFHGSGHVFGLVRLAQEHAAGIYEGLWSTLVPHLDRIHLPWDTETSAALRETVSRLSLEAEGVLLAPMSAVKGRGLEDLVAREIPPLTARVQQQRHALDAKVRLYVSDRRRQEILAALKDLEARAAAANMADALLVIRDAKREAERPAPDEGRLKRLLDNVVTMRDASQAVQDLAQRVQELIGWLAG